MRARSEFVRSRLKRQLTVPLIVISLCGRVLADTPIQIKASSNFYRFAQEFLRALYLIYPQGQQLPQVVYKVIGNPKVCLNCKVNP